MLLLARRLTEGVAAKTEGTGHPHPAAKDLPSGDGSYDKLRFLAPGQSPRWHSLDRALIVREAARLQAFPDDIEFKGSLNKGTIGSSIG
jgi:site-specific DNA-cytosine methylase